MSTLVCWMCHSERNQNSFVAKVYQKVWDATAKKFLEHVVGYICNVCVRKKTRKAIKEKKITEQNRLKLMLDGKEVKL